MPLIDSPRITPADRAAWERLAHYDDALAHDPRLDRLADRARRVIEAFTRRCWDETGHPPRLGISWGKDSVVVAHLAATSDVADKVSLHWVRVPELENPDCDPVREAFLARHPHMLDVYRETTDEQIPMELIDYQPLDPDNVGLKLRNLGGRYMSGVRGEESGQRKAAMKINGADSRNTARPIGWWTLLDVFAYLAREDLPIHPAYAMSMGGVLDRRKIRVSHVGGDRGTGFGREQWERRYYPDIWAKIDAARARRPRAL